MFCIEFDFHILHNIIDSAREKSNCFFMERGSQRVSRGEKMVLALTVLLLIAAVVCLSTMERGGTRYSISAMPEPSPAAALEMAEDQPLVNLNTATAEELAALPGIGSVRAARIVAYREEHGPFAHAEDVMDVYGIGEGLFAEFCACVTVA